MPLFYKTSRDGYTVGVWKIEETVDELLQDLPNRDYFENELERFKAPHRKLEWLSVRALLFTLMGRQVPIAYKESGKPYLDDNSAYVSISHTKSYVAVIISIESPVAIDIEQYSPRVRKVCSKFVREDEELRLFQGDDTWSMLLLWSAKETLFKSIDLSEIDFKEHLHILPFTPQQEGVFEAFEYKTCSKRQFAVNYLIHPDFVMTWQMDDSPRECNRNEI